MKLITTSAIVALTAFALASPSLARTPQCDWDDNEEDEAAETQEFAESLHLDGKFGASVNVWNGCYKVEYLGTDGKYKIEYYDPDSRQRVD